jgi:hypothetical protein
MSEAHPALSLLPTALPVIKSSVCVSLERFIHKCAKGRERHYPHNRRDQVIPRIDPLW